MYPPLPRKQPIGCSTDMWMHANVIRFPKVSRYFHKQKSLANLIKGRNSQYLCKNKTSSWNHLGWSMLMRSLCCRFYPASIDPVPWLKRPCRLSWTAQQRMSQLSQVEVFYVSKYTGIIQRAKWDYLRSTISSGKVIQNHAVQMLGIHTYIYIYMYICVYMYTYIYIYWCLKRKPAPALAKKHIGSSLSMLTQPLF